MERAELDADLPVPPAAVRSSEPAADLSRGLLESWAGGATRWPRCARSRSSRTWTRSSSPTWPAARGSSVVGAGERVITRWSAGRDFFVILEGRARVELEQGAARELGPGEFFGELAALDWGAGYGYVRLATVSAAEPLSLLAVPAETLNGLLAEAPALAAEIEAAARSGASVAPERRSSRPLRAQCFCLRFGPRHVALPLVQQHLASACGSRAPGPCRASRRSGSSRRSGPRPATWCRAPSRSCSSRSRSVALALAPDVAAAAALPASRRLARPAAGQRADQLGVRVATGRLALAQLEHPLEELDHLPGAALAVGGDDPHPALAGVDDRPDRDQALVLEDGRTSCVPGSFTLTTPLTGLALALFLKTGGPLPRTSKLRTAGVGSVLAAGSVARTRKK